MIHFVDHKKRQQKFKRDEQEIIDEKNFKRREMRQQKEDFIRQKRREERVQAKQTEKEIYERLELAAQLKERYLNEANHYVHLRKEASRLRMRSIEED